MDAGPDVAQYLPELVSDMWALGSTPEVVVDLLRPLGLPAAATRMLDLGCGKGALGITLALELGFRVVGVDLCREFLEDAVRRARELGVAKLCEFEVGDLRDKLAEGGDFDVVALASLGGVLGPFDECVGRIRMAVRRCGYIVIDDGFLTRRGSVGRPGYGHYASHAETRCRLTAHGDTLLEERIYTVEETRAINLDYIHHIARRAEGLLQRHPEAAAELRKYIANQESECEFIDKEITGAIWLLQRA